jgi:hypothetical protein
MVGIGQSTANVQTLESSKFLKFEEGDGDRTRNIQLGN